MLSSPHLQTCFQSREPSLPEHKQGWMLFLDEFNQATKSVQSASYKLILDRMTGQKKLHEKVVITAAGNLATDRAIVNVLGTAMQSRVVHIEMEINQRVAGRRGFEAKLRPTDHWLLGPVPIKVDDLRSEPHGQNVCSAAPCTWEFMNRLLSVTDVTDDRVALTVAPSPQVSPLSLFSSPKSTVH